MANVAEIGTEKFFVAVSNNIPQRQEVIEKITYRGVDDPIYRKLGKQSRPFQVAVKQDHATQSAAWDAAEALRDLTEAGLQQFKYHGEDFDTRDIQVKVRDFVLTNGPKFQKIIGGVDNSSGNRWVVSGTFTLEWLPKPTT